jgi:hypothetical protein
LFIKFPALPLAVLVLSAGSLLSAQTSTSNGTATAAQENPPAAPQSQQPSSPENSSTSASQQTSQDKEKSQTAPDASQQKNQSNSSSDSGTSKDRLFYALPNFLTLENGSKLPPLTVKQKFAVVARGSFDYVIFPWYGFLAGLSQAENSEPGYGQGAEGYGKRYGAAFADGTIENFMTQAVMPSILHQDPRYFQLGHGSFVHRTLYAASRNIVTRTDSGHSQFNFSEVIGGGASAFISTYSYHPEADKTVSNTIKVWGTQYGYDTITLVVKEFWPDIRRKMNHRKKQNAEQPASVAPSAPEHP